MMKKLHRNVGFTLVIAGLLVSGCSGDKINKVLKSNDDVPSKIEDRTLKWYASREDVSKQVIEICDSETSKYSERDDCQNAKGAEYAKLIQSNKDLSYDLRLNEDRKYLKEEMEKQKN